MPDKHRLLVIGAGSIGERHVRCFQATGRADVAVCDIDHARAAEVAATYAARCHPDLDAALAAAPEAAVIATPADLHVALAARLAERGVHLLIEKPLGTSLDAVERLRELVAERRLVAAVAYVYRLHPALAAMRQAVVEGRFGEPVELVAVAGQHFPTYRPAFRQTYYARRASGGGAIQDALTHVVNAAEWLIGPAERVVADAGRQVLDGVDVEDTVHLLARHGGVPASYALNQHQAPNELSITVVCRGGTARFEYHRDRWRWKTRPDEAWHDEACQPLTRDGLFTAQAEVFLDALEGLRQPPCSLDEGIQTLRVNLAALASVDRRAWQAVC
ncbi:MAG: Gfo/Idh/MocA family oxidoreductase [Pirellulales bacterium]